MILIIGVKKQNITIIILHYLPNCYQSQTH